MEEKKIEKVNPRPKPTSVSMFTSYASKSNGQSSCVIPENSVFFDGYVECVDLILPSSSLGDAQQACSEWSGRFITAEFRLAAIKQMA